MATVVDVVLVADRYDAGAGQDPRQAEWPPHPARVVSALRSVADLPHEVELLRRLEQLSPPLVHAAGLVSSARNRTYVVTNTVTAGGGNLSHVGRTSGMRERRSVFPASSRVQLLWDDLEKSDLGLLDELARRVPYLGRSTSVVLMGARHVDGTPDAPTGLDTYSPCEPTAATLWLRTPYPGYIDELEALHEAGLSAWQASDGGRSANPYLLVDDALADAGAPAPAASPYEDLIVLRFVDQRPSGRLVSLYTAALRSAVMSRTDDPLPPALHGHGIDGRPHVAYLALPVAGHQHADGHLVALGVAVPGMSAEERRRVLRGVLGSTEDDMVELVVPGRAEPVRLRYQPTERRPLAADARHWTAPARTWVSVTPVVLDRYPKHGDLLTEMRRSVVHAGLPEPESVEVSTQPMTPGGVRLMPRDLPKRARGRLFCHARIVFVRPVAGPILVGAGRYFGVGLFSAERDRERAGEVVDDGART